jgi:hypothetical protein
VRTGLPTNVTLFFNIGVSVFEATGVDGILGTAKMARENAGELDSPTSRERALGHTVCRLLAYNNIIIIL